MQNRLAFPASKASPTLSIPKMNEDSVLRTRMCKCHGITKPQAELVPKRFQRRTLWFCSMDDLHAWGPFAAEKLARDALAEDAAAVNTNPWLVVRGGKPYWNYDMNRAEERARRAHLIETGLTPLPETGEWGAV